MITKHFIIELKKRFDEGTWPWFIAALHQDSLVWDTLAGTAVGKQALAELPAQPESWSPASIALWMIHASDPQKGQKAIAVRPLATEVQRMVVQAHQQWRQAEAGASMTLEQAGLVALYWLEQRRARGGWHFLPAELNPAASSTRSILACLYGLASDPADLLQVLLARGDAGKLTSLAIHAFLSHPMDRERQVQFLKEVLLDLPVMDQLVTIQCLADQRPALALALADLLFKEDVRNLQASKTGSDDVAGVMGQLHELFLASEMKKYSGQPARSMQLLAEALLATRRLQAKMAAQLARTASLNSDLKTSLDAWKQAVQLSPETTGYTAELALAYLRAGRLSDAQSLLRPRETDISAVDTPEFLLAIALVQKQLGETDQASAAARQAVSLLENTGSLEADLRHQEHLGQLAELLLELGQVKDAGKIAALSLASIPHNPAMLTLLARTELAEGSIPTALNVSQMAASLQPGDSSILRLLIDVLEAADEWETAYNERLRLLKQHLQPGALEYRELANCAIKAGLPEEAAAYCQKSLELEPESGDAYQILGDVALSSGDPATALERYQNASQLAPSQPEPWLAMARIHQERNEMDRALEILRQGAQAAADMPEIHLALGEVYLHTRELTQALASLRLAAELIDGLSWKSRRFRSLELSKAYSTALFRKVSYLLGVTLFELGYLDEARKVLEETHRSFPHDADLAYTFARVLVAFNETQTAVPILEAIVQNDDCKHPAAAIDLARIYLQPLDVKAEQADRALELLNKALKLAPNSQEARALTGDALAACGKFEQAQEIYQQMLESPLAQNPTWQAHLSLGLGRVALRLDKPEIAVASLQEAANAEPENPVIYRILAEAFIAIGLADDAHHAARTALQLKISDLDMMEWYVDIIKRIAALPGSTQIEAQGEIIQTLRRASVIAPRALGYSIQLGEALLAAGQPGEAVETFASLADRLLKEDSLEQTDLDLSLLPDISRRLAQLNDCQKAIALLEHFIELDEKALLDRETPSFGFRVGLYMELANLYKEIQKIDEALEALDHALLLQPDSVALFQQKSDILSQAERFPEALAYSLEALRIKPDDPALLLRVALLYRVTGDLSAALEQVEKVIHQSALSPSGSALAMSARCLAAELSLALMAPKRAQEYLGSQWQSPLLSDLAAALVEVQEGSETTTSPGEILASPRDQFTYYCMQAELALNADNDNATLAPDGMELIDIPIRIAPRHPRCLALRARITARSGQVQLAMETLEAALENMEQTGEFPNISVESIEVVPTLRGLAIAAAELRQWDLASSLAQGASDAAPFEPFANYLSALILAQKAEFQRLCQQLDVIEHAPGAGALDDAAFHDFEMALSAATSCFERFADNNLTPPVEIARLKVRGTAVFKPSPEAVELFKDELKGGAVSAEEVAALMMVSHLIQENEIAAQASETYPQHPLVLRQLALLLAETTPRQAISTATSAIMYLSRFSLLQAMEAPLFQALIARLAHRNGERASDHLTALQAIRHALDVWTDEPRWHALAADILRRKDAVAEPPDLHAAIAHLQKSIRFEPDHAPHYIALGDICLEAGDVAQAAQILEQACQIAPQDPKAWTSAAWAYLGINELVQAEFAAEQANRLNNESVETLSLLGEIALKAGNAEKARRCAEALLADQTDNAAALHLLSKAYEALGKPGDALEMLERAIPMLGHPLSLQLERAQLLRRTRGLDQALWALKELAEQYPDEPLVLAPLAEVLMEAGQGEPAIQAARQALHDDEIKLTLEEQANLHYLIGRQLHHSGQLDQAVFHLGEAIVQSPDQVEPYLELGQVYQERRQLALSLKVYQQAIKLRKNDFRPYYHAALALKESKDYIEAEDMLRKATDLAPDDVNLHRLLGAVVALNLVHNRRPANVRV